MAKKSRPTFQKRAKELARQRKREAKEARRLQTKGRKAKAKPRVGDEDPDIAGIRQAHSRYPGSGMILATRNSS